MRALVTLHRWLGIGIGWLVALWCLSGVVMMYAGYPSLSPEEHYAGLAPLDLGCCTKLPAGDLDADLPVDGFELEMQLDSPRLALELPWGQAYVDLPSATFLEEMPPGAARAAAAEYARNAGLDGALHDLGEIESDQWTLTGEYDEHRPLHHFAIDDAAHSELYVSGTGGGVVLRTTRAERFWGWLGPVVHWIYPRRLRSHPGLWVDVIIVMTLAAGFLTALGLYIGLVRFGRRPDGRFSPYRGLALYHHYAGLVFGLVALCWIGSGLLSVNPWGLLESPGGDDAGARLAGGSLTAGAVLEHVEALAAHGLPPGTVSLAGALLGGKLYDEAYDASGHARRLDAQTLAATPISADELAAASERLAAGHVLLGVERLEHGDAYYFAGPREHTRPVYRVLVADPERTRYYLDAETGRLVGRYDRARRGYRWLFEGLHRLDFSAGLRQRPLWDILVLTLLGGAGFASIAGSYLGLRRLLR